MTGTSAERIAQAKRNTLLARNRFASTAGALQYRLRPGTIANNAWTGVRDKSGELADDAVQAVKERPVTASGVLAASVIFLARDPLRRSISRLFARRRDKDGRVITRLDEHDENFDLTAPVAPAMENEGVSA